MTSINLVIIDNNIEDYQTIIEALNSNTKYILFDGYHFEKNVPYSTSFLGFQSFQSINLSLLL